ncbi:MAG: chemotaxis protein [Alphaproteobacteria bacterium]|nr:chemotaxis protein [Alphaproteobacteria bacterium]
MTLNTAELPRRLDELVHLLRSRDERSITLVDVASVTGILISTMQAYFSSINTNIYTEFAELSKYIDQARRDIASLQPADLSEEHIPRAGMELDAIVEATESATNTIMQAAEEIMALDMGDMQAYQEHINDAVMRIFEACSFQDITGQRISKVVETFTYIESRLGKVAKLVEGLDGLDPGNEEETANEKRKRELILNGPQLKGEGRDQDEVDALMGDGMPPVSRISAEEPVEVEKAEVEKIAVNGKPPATARAPMPVQAVSASSSSDQSDIDAMFN